MRGASDLEFVRALMAACQRAENRALEAFRAEREASGAPALSTSLKGEVFAVPAAGEPEEPELRVGFTGLHAVTAENELSLRLDILNTTAGSAIAVLLLFLAVFRELRLALCIAATMGLSVAVTLALTALLHGKIGVMGAGFTCILLGMGVDYGIHLYSTFHHLCEENRYSAEEALRQTLARCGPGVLAACLTTLVAFLGIATTHFKMLAELGLLAGIGLGVCGVLMLTLFPALLYRGEGKKKGGHVARSIRGTTILLGKMHQRRRRGWLGVSLGLLGLLVAGGLLLGGPDPGADPVLGVRFDGELSNLRSLRIKAIPLRMEVTKRFGKAFADVKVVAEGPGEETAFAAAEAAQARLRPYFERGELLPSGGLLDYLPSARRQHETLAALRALDLPACKARFFEAARAEFGARAGASFKPFGDRLDEMQAGLADARPLTLEEVLAGPLAPVVGFFARIDGEGESRRVRILNNYLPASLAYGKAWFTELASEVEAGAPPHSSLRLVAARLVGFELKDSLLLDMEWISGAVTACVLVLLVCTFWSFKKAALAAVPLVFGILFVLAGVVVAQMCHKEFALNYVNLMIFPVLLGSAIDYGVYLVYDVYSSRRPALNEILTETGRGVLLCGLTTLAGFGSMVLGSYTGLIGFGYAAILGYVGALFGALIVLPGLLGLLGLGRERPESLKQPAER
ncbi:MAG: MMPL family transporter [Planctomycetota bacterium]|nr:MMPL family transporter [Planctomycetota bacterium]